MFWKYFTIVSVLVLGASAGQAQDAPFSTGPYVNEEAYFGARRAHTIRLDEVEVVGLIRAVELMIDDQVSDGCWTNSNAVRARIRAELERSGVAVFEEPLAGNWAFSPQLQFRALGYRLSTGTCIASMAMKVRITSTEEFGSLGFTSQVFALPGWMAPWEQHYVLSGGPTLNDQAVEIAQEFVDNLTADIISARRSDAVQQMLARWADTKPTTWREMEEMLAKWTASTDPQ